MRTYLGIVLLLFLSLGQVYAQNSNWSVWVYSATAGQAIQVDAVGAVLQTVSLPVPSRYPVGAYVYSTGLAVSPDGSRLAYRITGVDIDSLPLTTVQVYDVPNQRVLMSYNPPISPNADVFDFDASPKLFSTNGGAIAYSYATGTDEADQAWQMHILDSASGNILARLSHNDAVMVSLNSTVTQAPYLLPYIHHYSGSTLDFSLFPYQTFLNLPTDSFEWNTITGRVTLSQRYPTLTSDNLSATGEVIMPTVDERVAYDASFAPYLNALHVYRPDLGGRVPFYATTTLDILDVFFVQNGERLALVGLGLSDSNSTEIWQLVGRDGIAQSLPALRAEDSYVLGSPDGFVYVLGGDFPVLISANTRSAEVSQTAIWTGSPNNRYVPVWISPSSASENYGAWAQLAPALFAAQTVLVPSSTNSTGISPEQVPTPQLNASGALTVQGVAIINTTDGDRLNMRSDPSLSGAIIARVDNGSRVVILDGPVAADGFVWWQVRLATGLAGWVVERADNVPTLIPAG